MKMHTFLTAALLAAFSAGPVLAKPPHAGGGHEGCPPGLAKKNNGCMPPGQARKLGIGQPVPPYANYGIPQHVRPQLPPAPAGYRYAIVDNQIVLVSDSNVIVNILRGLLG